MGLRETKREKIFVKSQKQRQYQGQYQRQYQRQYQGQRQHKRRQHFKLKTRKGKSRKITRKIKIRHRLRLKHFKRGGRILPYPLKKGIKKTIKPLSANANSLSKVLEIPVPNKVIEIKAMCTILAMHYIISPKEKEKIEKKYEDVLEKMIEIYSTLEMKPFRVKNLDKIKAEFEEIKNPKSNERNEKNEKMPHKTLKHSQSKKLWGIKSYIKKSKKSKKRTMLGEPVDLDKPEPVDLDEPESVGLDEPVEIEEVKVISKSKVKNNKEKSLNMNIQYYVLNLTFN
jgi:dGTP triphosphohydrolase